MRYEVRATRNLQSNGQPEWDAAWVTTSTTSTSLFTVCRRYSYGSSRCRFQVRALTALGAGAWSAGVNVSTVVFPPTNPKP